MKKSLRIALVATLFASIASVVLAFPITPAPRPLQSQLASAPFTPAPRPTLPSMASAPFTPAPRP
jgi:hypothetical protein